MSAEIDFRFDPLAETSHDLRAGDSSAVARPDGCPSPLSWSQVLSAYRSESEPWTVTTEGAPVRGRTFGRGRPLYFLSGIAGTSDLFCLLVWLLRGEFRCVLFDYPLVRECPRARPRRRAEELACDLFAVADHHGDARFSLYATSFGGTVALAALAMNSSRIERAVLQGGFAHRRLSALERLLVRLGRLLPGRLAHVPFREQIHRANHQRYFPLFDAGRWSFFVDNAGRTSIRDLAQRGAIVRSFDYRRRLPEIAQPVLLIQSECEGLVSSDCHAELARGLPNATTEMLHSTGHLAYLTHPHRLAACVRRFLVDDCAALSPQAQSCIALSS